MSNAIKPEHYNRLNPQPKDVIRAWGLNFNLGSAVKYISRAGHIEITGKRNGKTDEEIAEIVDKTIKDIISGMAGVELEEIKEGNGYTEVHITGNANPIEVREYIERELKDRLAMVL